MTRSINPTLHTRPAVCICASRCGAISTLMLEATPPLVRSRVPAAVVGLLKVLGTDDQNERRLLVGERLDRGADAEELRRVVECGTPFAPRRQPRPY